MNEKSITPICLPKKRPSNNPNGTGCISEEIESPSKEFTPAFAKAKIGIIKKATYGLIKCSISNK